MISGDKIPVRGQEILNQQRKLRALKIKLISPAMSLRPMDSEFKRRMSPSLSLLIIATLTPLHHHVYIEDENLSPLDLTDTPDLVGITVNVDTSYRSFEIADNYRARGIKVIFGGIHASANPELMHGHCDSVCIGEAEEIWTIVLDDLMNDNLKSEYFNHGSTDLKNVPVPKWDLISKKNYLYTNVLVTSRGCPHRCEFCYNSCDYINNNYRSRPIKNILDEINCMDAKQVMFLDDNLIGNVPGTVELVDSIKCLNLIWHAAVSANLVKYPELIKSMSEAGCRSLFIGFESINTNSIKSVNKTQNKISEYESLIKQLHENNIMVNASLVFGFDHDTKDIFPETLDWLISNKVETMTAHILTPYPGTKIYKQLLQENRITDHNLRNYNTSNVVFQPKNMSADELRDGYLNMYRNFYSFRNIFLRKPDNKKLQAPYFIFNFGYRKFGKLTSHLGRLGLMNFIGRFGSKLAYGIE
jgi:radical SAM superfamily enzyme YgiQ (UPF0313 family)